MNNKEGGYAMDRFKYLSLGAITVLVLVLVVGLAAIAGRLRRRQ